jgi:hypothetical protein
VDLKTLIVFGVVTLGVLLLIVFGVGFVVFSNRAISGNFGQKAARLLELAKEEGILFAEDDVASFSRWMAPPAVAIRWPRIDVRVTPVALYLMQHEKMLGFRTNQPTLAMAPNGGLSTLACALVTPIELDAPPRIEKNAVVLEGRLRNMRFSTRLFVRDAPGLMRALGA